MDAAPAPMHGRMERMKRAWARAIEGRGPGANKLRTKCHDRAATDPIAPGRAPTRVCQTTCLFP